MKLKAIVCAGLAIMPLASFGDTIFSDTFGNGSTLNQAIFAPTANSTSYQTATQGAPGTLSIASGNLSFATANTGSVLGEIQALFPSTTLSTVGNFVHLTLTFTDTANVLIAGQNGNSTINVGLFNSGGNSLNAGPVNLSGATITGGAQNWVGYAGRLFLNGNASIINRKAQAVGTSATAQNQDLLFNNASGSAAFNNPPGTSLTTAGGTGNSAAGLTAGSTYTLDYKITLSAAGTETITEGLFNGTTPTGTPIYNVTGSATGANNLTPTFDGFAFGYRQNNGATSESAGLQVSGLTIDIQATPEPSTIALGGLGLAGLLAAYRRKTAK